jgi:dihydropteroate synthase
MDFKAVKAPQSTELPDFHLHPWDAHDLIQPPMAANPFIQPMKALTPRSWRVGGMNLGGHRPLVVGIVNVTPDSFFDGGRHQALDAALLHAELLVEQGVDILDIGGESTRPGANPVVAEEEIRRTAPVIEALAKRFKIPLSIDTLKWETARAALDVGAVILNDVSAFRDTRMGDLAREYQASAVLNHMQGEPRTMQLAPEYGDVVAEVRAALLTRVEALVSQGISHDRIAVDPGIGFGKRLEDNYALIENLDGFESLNCPLLLGHSRKSFIGKTPGLEKSDRLAPSLAVAVFAALKGVSLLRVHDVGPTVEALRMLEALRSGVAA